MTSSLYELPKCPRFSWDIRTVPWTDGRGSHEDYVNAIRSWSSFHEKLPDSNNNKIPIGIRGIMLHSHLYVQAKDICKDIPFSQIESSDGLELICKALHKRDPLSLISTVYTDFKQLLSTKRGAAETCRNFVSRFAAAAAKLKSHGMNALPEYFMSSMLLVSTNIDINQRIFILAAAMSNRNALHLLLPLSDSDMPNYN